jgi:K+-sensing histidine kinase KdpD
VRELSLHLLDVVENSIRAGATVVAIGVEVDRAADTLRLTIEDDGPGFVVSPDVAADPFFTTKSGKKTGLGLSLFRAAAERAAGTMGLGRSKLGGAKVAASMKLSHVDRSPLGDLATTIASIVAANDRLDVRLTLIGETAKEEIATAQAYPADRVTQARRMGADVEAAARRIWPGPV